MSSLFNLLFRRLAKWHLVGNVSNTVDKPEHSYKVSPGTCSVPFSLLIEIYFSDIMKSAKMPIKQRKLIQKHIDDGQPMPTFHHYTAFRPTVATSYASKRAKKRTQATMVSCGAYEVDQFIPITSTGTY